VPAARIGRARSLRTSNPPASPRTTSRAAAELPSTLQFLQILWTVNQALELASKRMALQLGVTGPQRLVIRLIGRFPGMSAGEVAATMRTDPSTLTGVLQRLEASRLIRRARDGSDARRVLLTLTGRGRAIDRLKAGTIEHAVDLALRGVPSRDISCTARTMWRITSTLQQMGDTAPLTVTAQGGLRVSGAAESRDHGRSAARPPSAADRA
jgi:DNA-binding MarR family transcriptional regulator